MIRRLLIAVTIALVGAVAVTIAPLDCRLAGGTETDITHYGGYVTTSFTARTVDGPREIVLQVWEPDAIMTSRVCER